MYDGETRSLALTEESLRADFPGVLERWGNLELSDKPLSDNHPALSSQLERFGKPIFDYVRPLSLSALELCYRTVMLFWNASRVAPDPTKDSLDPKLSEIRAILGQKIFDQMAIQTKRFESDPRFVVDVKVVQAEGGYKVRALSVIVKN